MFLANLPRPRPLELWAHPPREQHSDAHVYIFVLTLACVGGILHGVAMAIRKKYGEGHEKYWLEWKWWVGTILDGMAGAMIWPAMPFVSVHIFAPLIIILQLGTSYILGLVVFHEKCVLMHNVGLAFAVAGVIGLSLSTSHRAAHFTIAEFWAAWATTRFLATTFIIFGGLSGCFMMMQRSPFWALAAAYLEGVQYICSRSIVDTIFDYHVSQIIRQPPVFAAVGIKVGCILGILHFQQLGLSSDLSAFAGIYLCGCVFFMCIYGAAFFGDDMPITFTFFASAFFTLAGIWLLNQTQANKAEDSKSDTPSDVKESERSMAQAA